MICTQPSSAGPSTPRVGMPRSYSAPTTRSCASSYAFAGDNNRDAIFPFPGPAPTLRQRELYLRALEQEREEILAAAYASKRSSSTYGSSNSDPNTTSATSPFAEAYAQKSYYDVDDSDSEYEEDAKLARNDRGRRSGPNFRETVRQRQARLEFLRRQEFARRIAHRGLEGDLHASAYAIKRLPPPKAKTIRPIERVNAAIKIQRAWRVHYAVKGLQKLSSRATASRETFLMELKEKPRFEEAWRRYAEVLHGLLRELGERRGVISSNIENARTNKNQTLHPRVRAAARAATESLRTELAFLDRAQINPHFALSSVSDSSLSSSAPSLSSSSSISSDSHSEEEEFDSDSEYDSDDDYSSYTYTPPQLINTELYVVDEEDEDDEDDEEHFTQPSPKFYSNFESYRSSSLKLRHSSQRSSRIPVNSPGLVALPVSRSPSLASIPEAEEP